MCVLACTSVGACHARDAVAPDSNAIVVDANEVLIDLGGVPALAATGGSLVVPAANMLVIHPSAGDYRAFNNVCTHAGCGIWQFTGRRMVCSCHGSEFDLEGMNVVGPAPDPLPRYALSVDGSRMRVARRP